MSNRSRHIPRILVLTTGLSVVLVAFLSAFAPAARTRVPATLGFGLRMDLINASNPKALLNAAQVMKTDWIAQDIHWKDVEPQPGQYHWAQPDALALAVRPYGIRILVSLMGAPDWARPAGSDLTVDGPPADPATLANFSAALAKRYAGVISAYEIWPEANLISHWSDSQGVSPERYAELLRQTALAIRGADPLAIVISGGLAPTGANDGVNVIDDLTFYQRLYAAGAANSIDALGVRVDGYNNPPGDTPTFSSVATTNYKGHTSFYFRHYEAVREVMVANGGAKQAMWITSAGWASTATPLPGMSYAADVSEQQQADYLVEALAQAQAQPYISLIVVNNFNLSTVLNAPAQLIPYSLIRADWSARPAFTTLAQLRQGDVFSQPASATEETAAPAHILPNWHPRLRYLFQSRQP